jgi:hypothetical protein
MACSVQHLASSDGPKTLAFLFTNEIKKKYFKLKNKMEIDDHESQTSTEIAATWNSGHEELLASIADRANCSRWLHSKCQNIYSEMECSVEYTKYSCVHCGWISNYWHAWSYQ